MTFEILSMIFRRSIGAEDVRKDNELQRMFRTGVFERGSEKVAFKLPSVPVVTTTDGTKAGGQTIPATKPAPTSPIPVGPKVDPLKKSSQEPEN
jgi:hypothetical protein